MSPWPWFALIIALHIIFVPPSLAASGMLLASLVLFAVCSVIHDRRAVSRARQFGG